MKKLYYTVEKEIDDDGTGDEFLTGNKTITVYDIFNNEPKKLTDINCGNEENSKNKINDYLQDHDFGDYEFELIFL